MGIIKTKAQRDEEAKAKAEKENKFYDVWEKSENENKSQSTLAREKMAYPAPKLPLPGHAERYDSSYLHKATLISISAYNESLLPDYKMPGYKKAHLGKRASLITGNTVSNLKG